MKLFRRMAFMLILLSGASGCYHFGPISHPQLKTVAVGDVTNDTATYNAAALIKGSLCEQFMVDGSMKLVNISDADCILYARVIEVSFAEATHFSYVRDEDIYLPREWTAQVKIEYSLIMPGRKEPILKGMATGSSNFQAQADVATNQSQGVKQAGREAAFKLVRQITEGW